MALRVTAAEVRGIVRTTLDDAGVTPFLTTANLLVTEQLADSGLSDEMLAQIELWLAAHLVAIRDPEKQTRQVGDLRTSVQARDLGRGLDATPYGQQVRMLDTTGRLSALTDTERRPWMFRAGSPDSSC